MGNAMRVLTLYGFLSGVVTGALPFALLGFRAGSWLPATVILLIAGALCATAWRTPSALGCGVAVGTVAAGAAVAIQTGGDWRLFPYLILGFPMYYLVAVAGCFAGAWLLPRRSGSAT